jgi:hypothetical protein
MIDKLTQTSDFVNHRPLEERIAASVGGQTVDVSGHRANAK